MSKDSMQQLLEKDLINSSKLENLLRCEREQLEQRNIGALNETLIEKAQLLADIETNDHARQKILASFGESTDNGALKDFCVQNGLEVLYKDLLKNLQQCSDLTNINGAIVHRSKLNNRRLLDIMQGKSSQPGLYTSHGDSSTSSNSQALAKA